MNGQLLHLIVVLMALYSTAMYIRRLFRLRVQSQPADFVFMQLLGAIFPLLLIMRMQHTKPELVDVVVLVWSSLYLWRSRDRVAKYIADAEAGIEKREMEDVSETKIILKTKSATTPPQAPVNVEAPAVSQTNPIKQENGNGSGT